MNQISNKSKDFLFNIFPSLFFLLLLFNAFSLTATSLKEPALITLEWTLYITLGLLIYVLVRKRVHVKSATSFYIGIFLFTGAAIATHFMNQNYVDHSLFIQLLLTLAFFLAMMHSNWNSQQITLFAHISVLLLFLLIIHWGYQGFPDNRFKSYFTNPNVSGIFFLCLLFFPIAAFKGSRRLIQWYFSIGIIVGVVIIYLSTSRAVWLLFIVAIGSKLILSISKKVFSWLFFMVMSFNVLFLVSYGLLAKSDYAERLNAWSKAYVGKNFFSGREDIWGPTIKHGFNAPFFGHKIGIVPKDFMEGTHYVHIHNQYLQIFLESGLVGLICFVLFLFGIWKVLQKGLQFTLVQWSACFFLGLLIYQSVEISLFFNMQAIGLLHWFIIALGVSMSIQHSRSNL